MNRLWYRPLGFSLFRNTSNSSQLQATQLTEKRGWSEGQVCWLVKLEEVCRFLCLKKKKQNNKWWWQQRRKKPGVRNNNFKQGSKEEEKNSYIFCFFSSSPQWRWICCLVFRRGRRKKNNNVNSTCMFSNIASQLRMTSPESPAKDNPHRFYTKAPTNLLGNRMLKTQAYTSGPWGETKQEIGGKKAPSLLWARDCLLYYFSLSLSLQLYQQRPDSTI